MKYAVSCWTVITFVVLRSGCAPLLRLDQESGIGDGRGPLNFVELSALTGDAPGDGDDWTPNPPGR
jgi:hypothetical protein